MDDRNLGGSPGAGPPGGPPRWHPVGRIIFVLALFLLLQVVVGVPVLFIWAVLTNTNPMVLARGEGVGGFSLFIYVCMAPVVVALTVAFLRRTEGKEVSAIGARWPAAGAGATLGQAGSAVAAVAVVLGIWLGVASILGEVSFGGVASSFLEGAGPLRGTGGAALALTLEGLGFLIQGAVEEWVFRGYIFHALRERWSWASAAGGSSLVFAVVHTLNPGVDPAGLVNTFLLGLIFCAVVELTGSLVAPTFLHGSWNFLMAGILSVPVSGTTLFHLLDLQVTGPDYLTGGAYGPEASWVLTVLLVPVLLALVHRLERRRGSEAA